MSAPRVRWSALFTVGLLVAPSVASAKSVAVAMLLPRSGANAKQANQVTQLISSELDFMIDFDEVLEAKGPTNTSCLTQTGCLRGIANQAGSDTVITGAVSMRGDDFLFDLVYFDNGSGRIVRQQSFTLNSSPESVADGMNGVVTELLSGKSKADEEEEAVTVDDFDMSGDDFSFDDGDDFAFDKPDPAADRRAAEAEAKRRQEEEAARQAAAQRAAAEEARRRDEAAARARAESEARARAAADAQRRADEDARRRAEEAARRREESQARAPEPEFDPSMISFGAVDEDDITIDDIDDAIQFAAPSGSVVVEEAYKPPPRNTRPPPRDTYDDIEPVDLDGDFGDIDAPRRGGDEPSARSSRPTRSTNTKDKGGSQDAPAFEIKVHGGYSPYWSLAFITYGAELQKPVAGGLSVVAGLDGYSVERQIPEELWETYQRTAEWNTIFPVNLGLLYKIRNDSAFTPYVGADAIFAQYYVDGATSQAYWSKGARGRGGVDIRLTPPDSVGVSLNVDAAVGAWRGDKWTAIEETVGPSGLLPEISGGLVISL